MFKYVLLATLCATTVAEAQTSPSVEQVSAVCDTNEGLLLQAKGRLEQDNIALREQIADLTAKLKAANPTQADQ